MVKQQKAPAVGVPGVVVVSGRLRKRRRRKRLTRAQALRMLSQKQSEAEPGPDGSAGGLKVGNNGDGAVAGGSGEPGTSSGAVTPGGFINGEGSQEFLSTGRTGRRNAMPDILGEHADTGTADLPEKLEALTTDPSRSSSEAGPSHQQQQHAG